MKVSTSVLEDSKELTNLPEMWELVPVGNILKFEYGKALPARERNPNGDYPVFGSGGQVGTHSSALTASPVIIVGRKGSIGSIFYSSEPCWSIDTTYYIDNFPSYIYPKYIYFFLKTLGLNKLNRAAAIPGLSREDVYAFSIPIPFANDPIRSFDIQHRIVERIEAILAEVKESHNILDQMYRDAAQVMNAALEEVFTKVVSRLNSEQLASHVSHLTSGPRNWSKYASPGNKGALFIRVGNVGFSHIDLAKVERLNLPYNIGEERARVRPDDVLVTITGTIGRCCVAPENIEKAYVNQHVALVRLKDSLDPRYLMWFILSPSGGVRQTTAMQYGQTKPGLNLTNVRNLSLPIPEKSEQRQIVSYLDSIQIEADKMLKLLDQDAKMIDQLEQSILEQAFKGKL